MANQSDVRIQISAETNRLRADLAKAQGIFKNAFSSIEQTTKNLGSTLKTIFAGAFAGVSVAGVINAAKDIDALNKSMLAASGNAKQSAENMAFVRSEANRLGIDVNSAASAFTKLTAASRGTELEGENSRKVFSAIAGAMAQLGASAYDTEGALNAIQQMISKGKVSAEELRGQLGERLPGAFNIMARALKVTTPELDKMLSTGQILAKDALPKFADALNEAFPTGRFDAVGNEIARLTNTWEDFKRAIVNSEAIASGLRAIGGYFTAFVGGVQKQLAQIQAIRGGFSQEDIKTKIAGIDEAIAAKNEKLQRFKNVPLIGSAVTDKIYKNVVELNLQKQKLEKQLQSLQSQEFVGPPSPEKFEIPRAPKISVGGGGRASRSGRARASAAADKADSIIDASAITEAAAAAKQYSEELKDINDALAEKEIEDTILNPKLPEEVTDKLKETSQAAQEFGFILSSAAGDAISNWQGFGNLLQGILKDIAQLIIKLTVLQPLQEAVTGAVGAAASGAKRLVSRLFSFEHGGIMTPAGKLPLNAYAGGGVASGAQLALFGEGSRPEAFVPLPDGKSIPVSLSGGMSVVINDQRSASSPAAEVSQRRGPNGQEILEITIREEVKKLFNSGYMDKAMTSNYGARRPGISR